MFQLMTVEPKMSTEAVKPPLKISDKTSNIVFENVSFSYVCGQQILDNLSFEVRRHSPCPTSLLVVNELLLNPLLPGPGWSEIRYCRRLRLWQVHGNPAALQILQPQERLRPYWWSGHQQLGPGQREAKHLRGAPGLRPIPQHHQAQHRVREPRGPDSGDRERRQHG